MLDKSHRAPFTPFLYPSDREDSSLRIVGAAEGKLAVGALAVSDAGDRRGLLRSIAVSPEWQRRGVALGMLEYARTALPKLGCASLMTCLARELPGQGPVKALLKKAGFQASGGPVIAECPLSAFLESPVLKPFLGGKHAGVVPLGRVSGAALRKMNGRLISGGDLALPLDWERFSPSMSFCGMTDGLNITCCVCLRRWKRGVFIEWVYGESASVRTLMAAIAAAVSAAEKECGPEAVCGAVLTGGAASPLLEKLAGTPLRQSVSTRYELALQQGRV